MRYDYRLILNEPDTGSGNMAADYAIFESVSRGLSLPTLRIYSWSEPTVTIGYFQKVAETVNLDYCDNNRLNVIRRKTGGGTVLHLYEITYSFTTILRNSPVPENIHDSFYAILLPIISSLRDYGIESEFKPVNDITVKGRKISGSAQLREKGTIQQHGTILLEADINLFSSCLIHSREKLDKKNIKDPLDLITTVRDEIPDHYNSNFKNSFTDDLIKNYEDRFNIKFVYDDISSLERRRAQELRAKLFENDAWNRRR